MIATVQPETICAHRPAEVLDVLLPGKVNGQVDLTLELVEGGSGNKHPSWLAELLQPRRDIDPVAKEIVTFDHDIAEIDADAEYDPQLCRHISLSLCHFSLNGCPALYGVDNGCELYDRSIAHQLHYAAVVSGQKRVNKIAPQIPNCPKSARFIEFDQARVANNIGRHDGGEPSL